MNCDTNRLARIESRLVRVMLYMGLDPNDRSPAKPGAADRQALLAAIGEHYYHDWIGDELADGDEWGAEMDRMCSELVKHDEATA
jgi:hypothetical protein